VKKRKYQNRKFRLTTLAQAITLVCASIAADAVHADACTTPGTSVIAATPFDTCTLGNDLGLDLSVTVNSGVILGTTGTTASVFVTNGFTAGAITNNGTILDSSATSAYGIFLRTGSDISGGITNNAGALIRGVQTSYTSGFGIGIYLSSADISGGINNSGTIEGINNSGTGIGIGIYLSSSTMTGAITNNSGGIIRGSNTSSSSGIGIRLDNSDIAGGIDNSGTIIGINTSISTGYGIYLSNSDISGGITNNTGGIIQGSAPTSGYGIYLTNNSDISGGITNNNGGLIQGSGTIGIGIFATSSTITGGIVNSGTIRGTGASFGIGIGLANSIAGGITNNNGGLIQGSGTTGAGIFANSSTITGSIVNSGTIRGTGASFGIGIGLVNSDISGGIVNSGTIQGTGASTGTGIFISNSNISGGVTNNAGGLITGSDFGINIQSPTAAISVINNAGGTISSINLSNGTLNLSGVGNTGPVTGNIVNSTLNIVNTFTSGGNVTGFLNVTVIDGGIFNLGHNITATTFTVGGGTSGTLNVGTTTVTDTGAFNMAAGATFQTTINGAANDQSGKIVVSGAAIVPITATIDINTGAVTLVAGTTYKIIDGDGSAGVNIPTTITDNNANFNFVGSIVTGDLVLAVQAAAPPTPVPPGTTGLSSNARAVLGAVNAFITSDPALAAALGGLVTSAELNAALESLIPDMSGTAQNATFGAHDISIRTVENRLLSLRMAGGGMMTGMAAGDPYSQREIGMWLQVFGSTIDQDNRQGISGFDADTVGTALGADTLLTENLRIGGAFSYGSTDVDTKGSQNRTDISSYQGVFYASYERGDYYFDGIASYSLNNYDGSRNVVVGAVNRTAVADYDADQYGIKGTVGRTLQYRNLELSPYVSLLYVRLDTDGYTETGAGAANLIVNAETTNVLQSTVGVSISKEMATRKGTRFIPEAHIAWLHEFLNEGQVNTSTFTGGGGSFTTEGFDPADNSLNIGASVDIYKTEHLDFRAAYDFEVKEDFTGHSGQLILRYTFN